MEPLPEKTLVYKLPPELYDDFVESLEEVRETPKLEKLFKKPSPFRDCE
jgi:hypothetical protein